MMRCIVAMLDYFSKFENPIIRKLSKADGQLFKFLINNKFLRRLFDGRGWRQKVEEIYSNFDVKFQQDGHYWLQYGLFMRHSGKHEEARLMFHRSLQALPENVFAEHAYAQQLFIIASTKADLRQCERLVDEAVARLLALHGRQLGKTDRYPLITLAHYHLQFLVRFRQSNAAQKKAKEYFELLKTIERDDPNNQEIVAMKGALLLLGATGNWKPSHTPAED